MTDLENTGQENDDRHLKERIDIAKNRRDVAALEHRLNTAMIQKLSSEQKIEATPKQETERHTAREEFVSVTAGLGIPPETALDDELRLARTWGRRMRCLRHIMGFTQEQLADELRTSRNTIINYEKSDYKGKANGSIALAFDIYIKNQPNSADLRRRIDLLLASLK